MTSQSQHTAEPSTSPIQSQEQPMLKDATKRPSTAADVVGGSGHVPQLEEIDPDALNEQTGSSGADADRQRARKDSQ